MAQPLKDLFDRAFLKRLADAVAAEAPRFDRDGFLKGTRGPAWTGLELKGRVRHLATLLHLHLPGPYRRQLAVLRQVAPRFRGLTALVFPDFVECHGLDDPEASWPALEQFTAYSTSEFAVRPFIVLYEADAMKRMMVWTRHEDEHVRRLASEGCRPRLPWAMALPRFKANPEPILPILEALKADPSEYVRRSVANNLNDIAKDHPHVTLAIARRWLGVHPHTDALVKHACRTLLKKGDARALALFGYTHEVPARVEALVLSRSRLAKGDTLEFSFVVSHEQPEPTLLRIEYHLHFARPTGALSKKVFQIAERTLAPGSHRFTRRYTFVDRTIRVHHPGEHRLAVVVNGVEKASATVRLTRGRTSNVRP